MQLRLCALAFVLSFVGHAGAALHPDGVILVVDNEADVPFTVNWLNERNNNQLLQQRATPVLPGGSITINSFVGHSFVAIFAESSSAESTHWFAHSADPFVSVKFTASAWDDTVALRRREDGTLYAESSNTYTRTVDLMASAVEACSTLLGVAASNAAAAAAAAARGAGSCASGSSSKNAISPELLDCISQRVAANVAPKEKALSKTRIALTRVGDRSRNYTCADPMMDTTNTTIRTFEWHGKKTQVFWEEPSARIMLIDDFVSDTECKALMDRAKDRLQSATVRGDDGEDVLSTARRAKVGTVDPKLDPELHLLPGADPPTDLFRRGYEFANDQTGYGLQLEGQEGFSVIKYDSTDEYLPHCDGDCTGAAFRPGGRVATMIVYCEAAEVGGGTTFSNADVFIQAKKGQAAFFTYYDEQIGVTDAGITRHSGCPIIKGSKWIATMWMRLGVTAERDWQMFDPDGRPKLPFDDEDDEDDEAYTDPTDAEHGDGSKPAPPAEVFDGAPVSQYTDLSAGTKTVTVKLSDSMKAKLGVL